MENCPRCRLCGHSLKSDAGCSLCTEVKSNLIWPIIEDAESDLSAGSVINESLRAVKSRLRRLNRELTAEHSYDPKLTRDLTALGRTLKELAGEQRKLEDREQKHFASMGIQGRMQLFIEQFFSMLPEDYQRDLLNSMESCLNTQASPILLDE